MKYSKSIIASPLGDLVAVASETHLVMLEFADSKSLEKKLSVFNFVIPTKEESLSKSSYEKIYTWSLKVQEKWIPTGWQKENSILTHTILQLDEYFRGQRKTFDIPLAPNGTDFQKSAWQALEKIPYGETRSYKEEAILAGNPKAVRAIGGANNKNPIVIIVPCHRVIGADGSLVGYGWGMERKVWLLEHERQK